MCKYPECTVGAVIYNKDGKVLLCKSYKWNDQYVIPGGHIELGEKMEDALRREIIEETGLEIFDIKLISLKDSVYSKSFHEKKHFIFIDYKCKTNSYDVKLNDEADEYVWADLNDIENYDLGGCVKDLLLKLRDNGKSKNKAEIFYNY